MGIASPGTHCLTWRSTTSLFQGSGILSQIDIRKGMPPVKLSREEFETRYRSRFVDPVFEPLDQELSAIVDAAWDAYSRSRKSPVTCKAGPGFADPEYEIHRAGKFHEPGKGLMDPLPK
jgi:hypothetical protein